VAEHRHQVRLGQFHLILDGLPILPDLDADLSKQVVSHDVDDGLLYHGDNVLVLVLEHPRDHMPVQALRATRGEVEALLLD